MIFISEICLKPEFIESDTYPFNLKNIKNLKDKSLKVESNITFFVGENGSGKTTLLESIATLMGTNKYGGSKNFILKDKPPILEDYLTLVKKSFPKDVYFFRAESFFNLQKELEEYGQGLHYQYTGSEKTFREFSHGQGFKLFFSNRIRENGLYLLDEPESALSPQSQIEFLFLLKEFENMGCQFFIATHSPIILSYPKAKIFSFEKDSIKEVNYEECESYKSVKGFLDNFKRYSNEIEKL